ncbi:putative 60S ribosomal protein L9-A [Blattamonas nauphoetae]|uniref:60S ribosomal protein L9-A n=1 Tax=Blattamonas nauphoetae TaxID=2049346 RepID=A0ABQ9Y5R8_9EUKA|nr:putative 60S ribosomal protein L9-A [Blattamonas nauphoetae]
MKTILQSETITVPDNVTVECRNRCVRVTGPRGSIHKEFVHAPIQITKKGNQVTVSYWGGDRKQNALVHTVYTRIGNMITGVLRGYRYKMRSASAHFPIIIAISDDKKVVEVKNFLGEKRSRFIPLAEGVTAERSTANKDEIFLEGIDVENVGLMAAQIHQSILVKHKDIRKFLDGIFVSEKGHLDDE